MHLLSAKCASIVRLPSSKSRPESVLLRSGLYLLFVHSLCTLSVCRFQGTLFATSTVVGRRTFVTNLCIVCNGLFGAFEHLSKIISVPLFNFFFSVFTFYKIL